MKISSKTARLYIGGALLLALALLVFVQAAFDMNPFLRRYAFDPSAAAANQIVLLYTLSTLIFLALLVFGFVLLRTLVKVWAERKQQKPGSQFKTSVLTWLVALMLIPAISLFAFAYGLVNRSIDKWFSVPVDEIFRATNAMNTQWLGEHDAMVRSILAQFGSQIPANLDLESARQLFHLKTLTLIDPANPTDGFASDVVSLIGNQNEIVAHFETDTLGARLIDTPSGPKVLAAVFPTPQAITDLSATISQQRESYVELIKNQRFFKDTYLYLLALMTVLVLFAAVWVALFLSKGITVPIAALSAATREISAGNLGHRVDVKAEDELGMLVTSFNDMAAQLEGTTRELETRRRYMEVILESVPTGVISVNDDLRVNTLNRAAREMFSIEQALDLDEIFEGKDLDAVRGVLADATQNSVTREIAFVTPGRPAHSAVTACQLTTGGFVLVVEDLTEIVRAQKANAWREVARRLAHEIKNPLTPIQLSAERIGRNVTRLPGATLRVANVVNECVQTIVSEVSSLKNLVDEFVRFARLPAVSRVPDSMRDLVERTMSLYEGRMDGVNVSVDIPSDMPQVLMDAMQMRRVLVNLLDNALESLSSVDPKNLKITCDLARDGTMARLTIEDSGAGIAPEDRERLFTPYFSTRKNGTGLGLSIASRIVADHGGYIGAEPNSPRGTRFVIELPVCQESSLSTTSQASGSR
jgi:two-component system nitrogen regulation sensor histidine kinase NtrY